MSDIIVKYYKFFSLISFIKRMMSYFMNSILLWKIGRVCCYGGGFIDNKIMDKWIGGLSM